jgi:ABC-type multidrug transport system fused ATPase/permease subunit
MNAVILLCILIVAEIAMHIIYTLVEVRLRCGLINKIQNKVFGNILGADYLKVTSYHSGELVNRLENDVSVIAGCVTSIMPNICMLIARVVFSFGALYILDRRFAILCIVILPFVTIAGRIYGKRMKKLHKDCSTARGRVLSYMQEAIRNILVVKAFVKEQLSASRLGTLQNEAMKLNVKREIISLFVNLMFFAVMTFGYYCALIWCAYNISIGLMTVGTLTAILQLFDQLQSPFGELSSVIPRFYHMIASAERITEL